MSSSLRQCPYCESTDTHRSRSRWYDVFAPLFGYRPFRCRACGRRFYHSAETKPKERDERD